jgi:hypothetical protein
MRLQGTVRSLNLKGKESFPSQSAFFTAVNCKEKENKCLLVAARVTGKAQGLVGPRPVVDHRTTNHQQVLRIHGHLQYFRRR